MLRDAHFEKGTRYEEDTNKIMFTKEIASDLWK
jgi:hypothetical protein